MNGLNSIQHPKIDWFYSLFNSLIYVFWLEKIKTKTEVDVETQEPLPILTRFSRDWCEESGLSLAETVTDVIAAAERGLTERNPTTAVSGQDAEAVRFVKAIEAGIERANRKAISAAQRVQKWTILPVDFSIPGGELG